MADTKRRTRAGVAALLVVLVAALVAWLLWPQRDATGPASPAAPHTSAVGEAPAKPRARVREEAAPAVPESPGAPPPSVPKAGEPAEPTYPFEVTVLRADGSPAAGASVLVVSLDDDGNPTASATADAKGVATLRAPEDPVRVIAWLRAEAMATGDFVSPKAQGAVTVRLGPAMTVRGRVLRGDAPEAGADVELTAGPWFRSEFELELHATTDRAGRFEFPPIPFAGIHPLNPPYVYATTRDMASGVAEADPERPDAELAVHLKEGFTVRARFVDAEGKPAAAELWVKGPREYHATMDAEGRVSVRARTGGTFEYAALRTTSRAVASAFQDDDPSSQNWRVARALGQRDGDATGDVDLGDVVLAAGRPVVGRVVDSVGRPAPRARADLYLGSVYVGSVVTDTDGRFEFPEVGEDAHRIHVRAAAASPDDATSRHADVDDVRGGEPELRIVLEERLALAFRFLSDADRKPLACAQYAIHVRLHGEGNDWYGTDVAGDDAETASFEVLAPGSYDVEVVVGGYEPQRFESVEVVAGRPTTLELLLRKKHE